MPYYTIKLIAGNEIVVNDSKYDRTRIETESKKENKSVPSLGPRKNTPKEEAILADNALKKEAARLRSPSLHSNTRLLDDMSDLSNSHSLTTSQGRSRIKLMFYLYSSSHIRRNPPKSR